MKGYLIQTCANAIRSNPCISCLKGLWTRLLLSPRRQATLPGAVRCLTHRVASYFLSAFILTAIVSSVWAFFPQSNAEARSNMPEYMQERYILFQEAYLNSPWPSYMYHKVESVAFCESSLRWYATGDQGRALGYMQIRKDYHPRLDNTFSLYNGKDNLTAAYIIYLEAGRSWKPWSCKP